MSFRIAKFFSIELVRRYGGVTVSGRSVGIVAGALVIDGTKPVRDTLRYDVWRGRRPRLDQQRAANPCALRNFFPTHRSPPRGSAHRSDDAQ